METRGRRPQQSERRRIVKVEKLDDGRLTVSGVVVRLFISLFVEASPVARCRTCSDRNLLT